MSFDDNCEIKVVLKPKSLIVKFKDLAIKAKQCFSTVVVAPDGSGGTGGSGSSITIPMSFKNHGIQTNLITKLIRQPTQGGALNNNMFPIEIITEIADQFVSKSLQPRIQEDFQVIKTF